MQTAVNNQVNLVVGGTNNNVLFWDGSQTTSNGAVDGGSGVWSAAGNNWTNANGTLTLIGPDGTQRGFIRAPLNNQKLVAQLPGLVKRD